MSSIILLASVRRAGRLLPRRGAGLRAGVVALKPGEVMEWHSTDAREELLILLKGWVRVEIGSLRRARRQVRLGDRQLLFLPSHTRHRVINGSTKLARYLYITAPAR